jgi:hypothetical protein
MQTGLWMAYSDSTHFSDKNSYKILCILSYGLKDIDFSKNNTFLPFSEKTETGELFIPRRIAARVAD